MTPKRMILAAWLILLVAVALNTYQGIRNANSLAGEQARTCRVQARGLMAQLYLTAAMGEIVILVTRPAGEKIPPSERAVEVHVAGLRMALAAYLRIEDKQPKHLDCVVSP